MHPSPAGGPVDALARVTAPAVGRELVHRVAAVLIGKQREVELAVAAVLAGGHLLIEDLPGVGKTLLAKAVARAVGGSFQRVQGTPDLLPADLTGVSVFQPVTGDWELRPGPLFANVVLVDEINRSTARTQSALLEAMEEHHVTIDGVPRPLPVPFFVVATQNPYEHAGTFPLVEGQLDRFAVALRLGYASPETERELLLGAGGEPELGALEAVVGPPELRQVQELVAAVHCDTAVAGYVVEVVRATRAHRDVAIGASPRAGLALVGVARAAAVLAGRDYVSPDDVKAVAAPVLAHRVITTNGPDLGSGARVVEEVLAAVPFPRP